MPISRLQRPALCLLLSAVSLLAVAQDAEPLAKEAKAKGGKKAPTPQEQVTTSSDGIGAMGSLIPEGMKNRKVRIPGFEDGRATSLITADVMTRVDPQHLFAEGMTIKIFGADPKEDVRVDLKTATYQMESKVLSSQERSRVSRSDFQLEGDTMVFDTTTSQGKMVGRVQMIIYDTNQFSSKPAQAVPVPTDAKDKTGVPTPQTSATPDQAPAAQANPAVK